MSSRGIEKVKNSEFYPNYENLCLQWEKYKDEGFSQPIQEALIKIMLLFNTKSFQLIHARYAINTKVS